MKFLICDEYGEMWIVTVKDEKIKENCSVESGIEWVIDEYKIKLASSDFEWGVLKELNFKFDD